MVITVIKHSENPLMLQWDSGGSRFIVASGRTTLHSSRIIRS
eukprot:XP_001704934.1 Hypothetical protein GL50803_26587 [Giardia lamblia ATCC 50803]